MDEWVERALAKWPNVPALYGWLGLTRRGRWLIKGETISNPKIIRVINRNYAADEQGRWFFQNGPQRGYIKLEYAPLILRSENNGSLTTHTGVAVESAQGAYVDEEGSFILDTPLGAGLLSDHDLDWALDRLCVNGAPVTEAQLATALAQASGTTTELTLQVFNRELPVQRCDAQALGHALGFVREPAPLTGENGAD